MALGAPKVAPLPLGGPRGLGSSLFPGQKGSSCTICQCLITVVEGLEKTVWQDHLDQLEPFLGAGARVASGATRESLQEIRAVPTGPQSYPGGLDSWRSLEVMVWLEEG